MYVENETITPNGVIVTFTLSQKYKPGTVKVLFDNKLTYDCHEAGNKQDIVFDVAPTASRVITVSYYPEDENNTINYFRYTTPAQVKAWTRVADLATELDDDIEKLIREAEFAIDDYVGFFYKKLNQDDGQVLMFPRKEDELYGIDDTHPVVYNGIPEDVSRACMYAVENIFLNGAVTATSGAAAGDLVSETIGDYSYRLSEGVSASNSGSKADSASIIGERARTLLKKYQRKYKELKIDSDSPDRLNSRRRWVNSHI